MQAHTNIKTQYDAPGFWDLLKDNLKTTAFFGGITTGIPTFAAGGIAGWVISCPVAIPLAMESQYTKYARIPFLTGGTIAGAPAFAVGSTVAATLFSIPFTIAAYFRQFKSNVEIKPHVDRLLAFVDSLDQKYIIDKILEQNKRSINRSFESAVLIYKLENSDFSIQEKYSFLTAYMKAQNDDGAYINNGKTLFNTILDIAASAEVKKRMNIRIALATGERTEILKQNGANFYKQDNNQLNYFLRAVIRNDVNAINTLLKIKFISKSVLDFHQGFDLACQHGHLKLVHALKEAGAVHDNAIASATKNGHLEVLKYLLQDEQDINPMLLHLAAEHGHKNIVNYLVKEKNLNVNHLSIENETASQVARKKGHTDLAIYLAWEERVSRLDVNQVRKELIILWDIIENPAWSSQGDGFFTSRCKTPKGIEWMQGFKKNHSSHPRDMTDQSILLTAFQLHHHHYDSSKYRTSNTAAAYRIAQSLGENTAEDLEFLQPFRPISNIGSNLHFSQSAD